MPQAAAATPSPASVTPESVLRATQAHALRMAALAMAPGADAVAVVRVAMRAFARDHARHPPDQWPVLFWRALHAALSREKPVTDPGSAGDATPFLQRGDADATAQLDAALRALPLRQRQAFLLRVWNDLDVARIARALDTPESGIKTELIVALRTLRARLDTGHAAGTGAPARDDGRWILRCRGLLDASARAIDASTRERLDLMREAALAPPAARQARGARALAWVGGIAVAIGVALVVSRLLPSHDASAPDGTGPIASEQAAPPTPGQASDAPGSSALPSAPPPSIAPTADTPLAAPDFDLLVDGEDEALLEDLEFYAWLHAGGARAQ